MTIRVRFNTIKPRVELARRARISEAYACNIAKGQPIGGTETLARIAAALELSDEEIGASVREMYPAPFVKPEHATDAA